MPGSASLLLREHTQIYSLPQGLSRSRACLTKLQVGLAAKAKHLKGPEVFFHRGGKEAAFGAEKHKATSSAPAFNFLVHHCSFTWINSAAC